MPFLSPIRDAWLVSPLLAQADGGVAQAVDKLGKTPYYVLGAYLLLLLVLGIAGWLKSKTGEEDYYLASRGQGWMVSSLTIMATFFSSFALLGAPGMVYREGVLFALFSLNVPVAGVCVYLLGSRIWKVGRTLGYVTPGDMAADYYGSRVSLRLLIALAGVLYSVPYVVMQIQAGGLLSEALFGAGSFSGGAILLAAITMLYIMIGGMRSVAWTDLIQGLLLISGMLVCGFAMLLVFGGPAEFGKQVLNTLPDSSLTIPGNTGGWKWPLLFTICILGSSGSMVQPAQWMRYYSASSAQTLKRGAVIFAAVLTTCFILGVMLIGIAGQVLYPLQFTVTESIAEAPAALTGEIPAPLQQRIGYVPSKPAESDSKPVPGRLSWTWSGRDIGAISDADAAQLKQLSSDPSYQAGIDRLQANLQELEAGGPYLATIGRLNEATGRTDLKLDVAPHANVDPNPADGKDFDSILIVVLKNQLPEHLGRFGAVFASLIIVAIMAASMSTADSNLHALSALMTRDIYDQYVRPQAGERERVWVGRLIIFGATALSLVIVIQGRETGALSQHNILNMIAQLGFTAIDFSTQLLPIAVDMLFLRKGTGKGAAAGLAAGLLAAFVFGPLFAMFVGAIGSPEVLDTMVDQVKAINGEVPMHKSVWGLMVNIPVFALVSLVTRKPDPAKVAQYNEIFRGTAAR